MKTPIHPRQVRAARALLAMSQEELAARAQIGVATIKRFESGRFTRSDVERSLRSALEREGIIILNADSVFEGHPIGVGVAVRPNAFSDSLEKGAEVNNGGRPRRTRSM